MSGLREAVFDLTVYCTENSREVEQVTRGIGGRSDEAFSAPSHSVDYTPPSGVEVDDWDHDWSPLVALGLAGGRSYKAALPFNQKEVSRARDLLNRVEGGPYADTDVGRGDVRFLKNVLALFHRWFQDHGFPMPGAQPKNERQGDVYARDLHPCLGEASNLAELCRAAYGEEKTDGKLVGRVRAALKRQGYYPKGRPRTDAYLVMCSRIRRYVENGIRPTRPTVD